MKDSPAILVSGVSKRFVIPHQRHDSLKQAFMYMLRPRGSTILRAVDDLSFEVKKGEFFAIVGRNGSGKSTLLKMLAGIYPTDRGHIRVDGKLAPFIELGVGFNPELSARDNVYLNGSLLGMNRHQIAAVFDDIIDFAELKDFIDQKLKNYSSGMQVRLAFSIAIQAQADILLMDEVLAVGDANFQAKCFRYFRDVKRQGRTLVLVSHDMNVIEEFCDRGILLENGRLVHEGPVTEIRDRYNEITLEHIQRANLQQPIDQRAPQEISSKIGDILRIENLTIRANKHKTTRIKPEQSVEISFDAHCLKAVDDQPILGVSLINAASGQVYLATNTRFAKISVPKPKKSQRLHFSCRFKNVLGDGDYYVEPAIADSTAMFFYDRKPAARTITVAGWQNTFTSVHIDHKVEVT